MLKIADQIEGGRRIKRRLSQQLATYLSKNWDLKHGVDTSGRIPLSLADGTVDGDYLSSGYDVVSTPTSVFMHLAKFFPARRADYTYLDIGSGKARTVMLASEMGFKSCVGVEFANFACEIAQKNLQSYIGTSTHRSPCSIINACATKFAFPEGNAVLFFNNPFSEDIWKEMVQRVRGIATQERAITLILIGSFPDTIRSAAQMLLQSGCFSLRAEGITPPFWDSYARFHFFVLKNSAD